MTRLAGVIGDPISHSRSPILHGHWLARYGIDGQYVPLHIQPDDLESALELLPRMGFSGINVTIPHKERVFALADDVTARAEAVGAANTLTFRDGRVHADNTDGVGFIANLDQQHTTRDKAAPALVLGAGGAARGIIAALLADGTSRVILTNRTLAKAEALAALFPDRVDVTPWDHLSGGLNGCGLLVNTTSLGMSGQPPLEIDLSDLAPNALVTDIVYTPLMTDLLRQAQARGNPVVDGLGMLLHQAAPGFETWFGRKPEVDEALRQAVLS